MYIYVMILSIVIVSKFSCKECVIFCLFKIVG